MNNQSTDWLIDSICRIFLNFTLKKENVDLNPESIWFRLVLNFAQAQL